MIERLTVALFGDDYATVTVDVGSGLGRSGSTAIYVNGVFNITEDAATASGELLAEFYGRPFDVVWNPSAVSEHGFVLGPVLDLVQVPMVNWNDYLDESTKALVLQMRRRLHGRSSSDPLLVVAHSQGAAILSSALTHLSLDERARVDIVTYGGAVIKFPEGVRSLKQVVAITDVVPMTIGAGNDLLSTHNVWRLGRIVHPLEQYIEHEKRLQQKRKREARSASAENARAAQSLQRILAQNRHRLRK